MLNEVTADNNCLSPKPAVTAFNNSLLVQSIVHDCNNNLLNCGGLMMSSIMSPCRHSKILKSDMSDLTEL